MNQSFGNTASYAKFETFPVWNLPLKHPVNLAYEASTADLKDINMIDPYHLETYSISSVNYNRDIESFPILKNILSKICVNNVYNSPTDMGVNMVKSCIINDDIIKEAACKEIIRRYYNAKQEYALGNASKEVYSRIKLLMQELSISKTMLPIIDFSLKKQEEKSSHIVALQLKNGKMISGKMTDLLTPTSSLILNCIKELSNIPDDTYLLSPDVLNPILSIKRKTSYSKNLVLGLQEVLIALSICSSTNNVIEYAFNNLELLNGCEAHSTYILNNDELNILKNLGINITCEAVFM